MLCLDVRGRTFPCGCPVLRTSAKRWRTHPCRVRLSGRRSFGPERRVASQNERGGTSLEVCCSGAWKAARGGWIVESYRPEKAGQARDKRAREHISRPLLVQLEPPLLRQAQQPASVPGGTDNHHLRHRRRACGGGLLAELGQDTPRRGGRQRLLGRQDTVGGAADRQGPGRGAS